jgi:hypothetical protein
MPPRSALHVHAHRAGGARDGVHRRIQARRRQVGHLGLRDRLELLALDLADLRVFGRPLPFSMPSALRISTDAGGVFRMNVKLRSL